MQQVLKTNGFTFKRFFVAHDQSPMKVTTDSVVLASWLPLITNCQLNGHNQAQDRVQRILDIGTGCGVIALILAQRTEKNSPATLIDGIEIDAAACQQAKSNMQQSPWHERLSVIDGDVLNYGQQMTSHYDLLVSNPPYFPLGSDCRSDARSKGRYTISLNHQNLLACASNLLKPTGRLCLILPFQPGQQLQQQAIEWGWYLGQQLWIRHTEYKLPALLAFELGKIPLHAQTSILTIRDNNGHYTEEFYSLTKDFQLFRQRGELL